MTPHQTTSARKTTTLLLAGSAFLGSFLAKSASAQPQENQAPQITFQLPENFDNYDENQIEGLLETLGKLDPSIKGVAQGEPANPENADARAFLAAFAVNFGRMWNPDFTKTVLAAGQRDLGNATNPKLNQTLFIDFVLDMRVDDTANIMLPNGTIEQQTGFIEAKDILRARFYELNKSLQNDDAKKLINGSDIVIRTVLKGEDSEFEIMRFEFKNGKKYLTVADKQPVEITNANLTEKLADAKIGLRTYEYLATYMGAGKLPVDTAFKLWTAYQGYNSVYTPSTKSFDADGPYQLMIRSAVDGIVPPGQKATRGGLSESFTYRFNKPQVIANVRGLAIGGKYPGTNVLAYSWERKEVLDIIEGPLKYGTKIAPEKAIPATPDNKGDALTTDNNTPFVPVNYKHRQILKALAFGL